MLALRAKVGDNTTLPVSCPAAIRFSHGPPIMLRSVALLSAFALLFARPTVAAEPPAFNAQIRPLFKANCFECHGEGEKLKGDLDLRLRRFAAKGGTTGPAFVEGNPGASLLLEKVASGGYVIPPKKPATPAPAKPAKEAAE